MDGRNAIQGNVAGQAQRASAKIKETGITAGLSNQWRNGMVPKVELDWGVHGWGDDLEPSFASTVSDIVCGLVGVALLVGVPIWLVFG